jgi:hypothetical protein
MLIAAYLVGILAVGVFVVSCAYARQGARWARVVIWVEICVFVGLAAIGFFLALLLMLVGEREESGTGASVGWWTQGQGQQFFVAVLGSLVLAGVCLSLRTRQFLSAAILAVAAAVLFGLWGLLVEAGWSGSGPLAG